MKTIKLDAQQKQVLRAYFIPNAWKKDVDEEMYQKMARSFMGSKLLIKLAFKNIGQAFISEFKRIFKK